MHARRGERPTLFIREDVLAGEFARAIFLQRGVARLRHRHRHRELRLLHDDAHPPLLEVHRPPLKSEHVPLQKSEIDQTRKESLKKLQAREGVSRRVAVWPDTAAEAACVRVTFARPGDTECASRAEVSGGWRKMPLPGN